MNGIDSIMNAHDAAFRVNAMHGRTDAPGAMQSFDQLLASKSERSDPARESAQKLVGMALFLPLLKQMQNSPFKTDVFHGGRGEEVFTQQLHMTLADRLGQRMGGQLVDAVAERMQAFQANNG